MKSISVSTLKARMNSESKSQVKESSVIISKERRGDMERIDNWVEILILLPIYLDFASIYDDDE
jgi:hypothetical protein